MLSVPFLLLGCICVLLIFLLQKISTRHLSQIQEQLYSLEEKNQELCEQLHAQIMNASEQLEEARRLLTLLEADLEAAKGALRALEEQHPLRVHAEMLARELEEAKNALHAFEADKQLVELRASLTQLRKQFEEKSEVLQQTRKQLFTVEGELILLQKEQGEQKCLISAEEQALLSSMQQYEEECHVLEQDVMHLQNLVSSLLAQKSKSVRKRKKESEEDFFSTYRK